MDSRSLSVLYRVTRLAEFTDLAPLELLQLVDVIENDPNLKVLNGLDVLVHEDVSETDLYQVLEEGPLEARSWLIQNIVAIAAWAGAASSGARRLESITAISAPATAAQKAESLATAQAFYDAFLPTALTAEFAALRQHHGAHGTRRPGHLPPAGTVVGLSSGRAPLNIR